jgi:glycosyltransferase involved in cell wall biosynthesis
VSDRLQVTHVVHALDVGGLERNVVNQVREGASLGQDVSILCLEHPGAIAEKVEAMGAEVVSLGKKPGFRPCLIASVRKALLRLRPDVVHTHHPAALFYSGPAAYLGSVPVVLHTEHGHFNYATRRRLRWLSWFAGRFTDRYYCLSQDMADAVVGHGVAKREKVRVIQNGIYMSDYRTPCDTSIVRQSLGIPQSAPVIGTIGRLHEIKRQDVLLRGFARVQARIPEVHLLFVGEGPLREELTTLATQLGVADCVHFAGFQDWTPPYLQTMTCFALTSRSEGMPQSVLEACVAGVPVITSRVGGLPELIEHGRTGLLFEPGNDEALATGLLELLTRPDLARRLADAAQSKVTPRFDVRRMAREYHNDCLELLAAKAPRILARLSI